MSCAIAAWPVKAADLTKTAVLQRQAGWLCFASRTELTTVRDAIATGPYVATRSSDISLGESSFLWRERMIEC
jgi:hypothetical protein